MKRRRFADAILVVFGISSTAMAISGARLGVPHEDVLAFAIVVLLPAALAVGLLSCLAARPPIRDNIALLVSSLLVAGLVLDLVALTLPPRALPDTRDAALARGQTFDARSRQQVVRDLRTSGIDAGIALPARVMRQFAYHGRIAAGVPRRRVFPLANQSNALLIDCNESGHFNIFRTDELGFSNPPGIWDGPPDIAIIGDSFAQGACVDPDSTLGARIRHRWPRTVTAGLGDFGPLSELGVLEEYVAGHAPRHVFWLYYEGNDLHDLAFELREPELRRYLTSDSTQNLIAIRDTVESELAGLIDEFVGGQVDNPGIESVRPTANRRVKDLLLPVLTLHHLRDALGVADLRARFGLCCDLRSFTDILRKARGTVEAWGGRLHFVYLPSANRYYRRASAVTDDGLRQRRRVLAAARAAGLGVVDVDKAFRETGDPRAMFYTARTHFNDTGYRVAAQAIIRYMERLDPEMR